MSKVAEYLQQHVVGEVLTTQDAREYFSKDSSIFKITPQIIVYPRTENDVRKIARFSWQLAERGRLVPITARGLGTDQGGAAIGPGILVVFPAHMNKILSLDSNKGFVSAQPGTNFGRIQQTLLTHGQFLPPYPASMEYSTIGGAVANNAAGEKTVKYGTMKDFTRQLRVVLANGEVIVTKRLSKKELVHKKGLPTFEGEIYRSIDNILSDNIDIIENSQPAVSKNTAGYDIWSVKGNDGSFDLTPLFAGSQGTLGIISEIICDTETYNPNKSLIVAKIDTLEHLGVAVSKIRDLNPSALELVDYHLLDFTNKTNPNYLKDTIQPPFPHFVLFIEFDDISGRKQKNRVKKSKKILESLKSQIVISKDNHEQEDYWKIRHSASAVIWQHPGNKRALPVIEDGIVPLENLTEFINKVYELFKVFNLEIAIWGHVGNANLQIQPYFDLSSLGDRQQMFKLMDAYYDLVFSFGGSTSGEHNDGRIRAPYLVKMYGQEIYEIFRKIKQQLDPYGTLNPGVKIDVTVNDNQKILRVFEYYRRR
ncbi:MAG: FAD-binding oxidoreductase [Patescibacteria group bacterium]|nr:FAD-binding oxidoreductase [Patescibacteria group bacterium]